MLLDWRAVPTGIGSFPVSRMFLSNRPFLIGVRGAPALPFRARGTRTPTTRPRRGADTYHAATTGRGTPSVRATTTKNRARWVVVGTEVSRNWLTALAGLRTLRHLDLYFTGRQQIFAGYAETPGGNLLNG